jgi:ABC transporter substrate binding protein
MPTICAKDLRKSQENSWSCLACKSSRPRPASSRCHRHCSPAPTRGSNERREFITLLGGAVAWPLAARAQQLAIPVIGFLSFRSANESATSVAAFREGLSQIGYAEGRSVHIAFRWAEGQNDQLPMLASDLVDNLHVAVIVAAAGSAIAAKAATKTIPIVFTYHADPVKAGIVASLNQPEEKLHDLVPSAATMALLVDPRDPEAQPELLDAQDAARRLNLKLVV